MANEITVGGGGSSSTPQQVNLTFEALMKIDALLNDTETYLSNVFSNKLLQLQNGVYTAINNGTNIVTSKISNATSQIVNTINSQANTTNLKLQMAVSQIDTEIDKTQSAINSTIALSTSNIFKQLDIVQNNILNSLKSSGYDTQDEIKEQTLAIKTSALVIRDAIIELINLLPTNLTNAIDNSQLVEIIRDSIDDETWTSNLGIGTAINSIRAGLIAAMGDTSDITWLDRFNGVFDKLATNKYTDFSELMDDIKVLFGSNVLIGSLIGIGVFASTAWQLIWSIGEPFAKNVLQLSASAATPNELSATELLRLHSLGFMDENQFYSRMKEIGYNNRNSEDYENLKFNTMTENQVRIAYQRGILSENDLETQKKRLGYTDYNWQIAKKLWEYYPTPPDVVAFANRDVFEPDVINEFGLNQELSEDYLKLAQQIGLSEDFAKMYWYAHWYLPSLTQGYEMLHRGVIDETQLNKLFKAQDIVPFWREKLMEISYTPLVRVDVRRIHKMGIITDADLIQSYKNTGYNQKDAEIMAQWTKVYNGMGGDEGYIDTKNLTRSLIVKAYTSGLFEREIAIQRLIDIGHSTEDAEVILDLSSLDDYLNSIPSLQKDNAERIQKMVEYGVINGLLNKNEAKNELQTLGMTEEQTNNEIAFLEWEKFISIRELLIKNIRGKYIRFVLSRNDVMNSLRNNGFSNEEIEDLITQWDIIRDDRDNLPTKNELEEMLLKGVIDIEMWLNYMRGLGYSDVIIEHYLGLIVGSE